jgi:hypothetical protein
VLDPTDRHTEAFDAAPKMQTKAYRSNQPSKTSYIERVRETANLLNFQPADFDIISLRDETARVRERRPMTAIYQGNCKSVHPLSHFQHLTRVTAPNHHEGYQKAIKDNENTFRRANGPFTDWFD